MKRRSFITSALAGIASMGVGTSMQAQPAGIVGRSAERRNPMAKHVLFFIVDDLNVSLGCYGHPAVYTPNIDRIAARGVRFANAFCPYPLCGPSRTAMMTGRRPESFPMGINEVAWRDCEPELKTLPQILREQGFYTAGFGKIFHHGIQEKDLEEWTQAHPDAFLPHTFDDPPSWDESFAEKAEVREQQAEGPEQVIDGRPFGGTSLHTIRATNPEILPDAITASQAVAFLESDTPRTKRFFLGVGFHKPHVPLVAPEKWWAYYDSLDVEELVPPTWFEPAKVPPGTFKQDRFHRDATEEQRRHLYKGYLACVSHMDEQVGKVLNALEKQGLDEDTLIVFVADHGYHIGEQAQWDKMMLLDPATQVPLIFAGPGIQGGQVCQAVTESLDVFPTLFTQLGQNIQQKAHGKDLTPWINDPHQSTARPAFQWVQAGGREGWAIRTDTHRFGLMSENGDTPRPFLFDLEADPHEARNITNVEAITQMQSDFERRLRAHFRDSSPIP